ncbi:MAG: rod shape-determining protein RodA [Candidatus Pacebacteria bacterium]|nr:rod shape-determining protein RodA [Candidatus Paceibacterota bacterium]
MFLDFIKKIDWKIVFIVLPIVFFGIVTMQSFAPTEDVGNFATKQIVWTSISFLVFLFFSFLDFSFLKQTKVLVYLFLFFSGLLLFLFILGQVSNGAQSWFNFGGIFLQPVDMMKLVLILVLAKYFSRRHVEIKNFKHIFISGLYALIPFVLVFLQPDFGSAMVIFFIWLGMVLVSGISKKHLSIVFGGAVLVFLVLWTSVFAPYQKDRILNFFNPLADIRGSGYNVFQSTIAVGSGQFMGKGIGFGTQSRLKFLPEPQTDFIFAAFSEEWGFVGSVTLLILFGLLIWRILYFASFGASNFETLFALGVAIYFITHILINIGMNLGVMPVTGIPLPFMSYGGSHLLTEFAALGILVSMHRYKRRAHRDDIKNEFLGY